MEIIGYYIIDVAVLTVILTVCYCIGYKYGRRSVRVVTISDTVKKESLSGKNTLKLKNQVGVMQLQDEIAKSGALCFTKLENGDEKVTLRVVV